MSCPSQWNNLQLTPKLKEPIYRLILKWNIIISDISILIVLMIIGGGTCSTSGGLKQYRVYLLYKAILWELTRPFYPRGAVIQHQIWQGEAPDYMTDRQIRQTAAFVYLYLAVFILGSGILSAYGYSLKDAMFEFASALGTVGLSVGLTTAQSPPGFLWTETLGMFLGRLEFFIVFVSVGKIIRDLYRMWPS